MRLYSRCYWIAGILQVEKGSFVNMSDVKQNTTLKGSWSADRAKRLREPCSGHCYSFLCILGAIWVHSKKPEENVQYSALAVFLGPLQMPGRMSELRLAGWERAHLTSCLQGLPQPQHHVPIMEFRMQISSRWDGWKTETAMDPEGFQSSPLNIPSVSPGAGSPVLCHGRGLLGNLGTSRWTVNHSLNIDLIIYFTPDNARHFTTASCLSPSSWKGCLCILILELSIKPQLWRLLEQSRGIAS